MARVLIAGCGYVGTVAAAELAAAGDEVWTLRRSSGAVAGTHGLSADLTDPSTLVDLPGGLDFVMYTAAADAHEDGAYRRAYVEGVRNLLQALVDQGQRPRRVVFTSSTGVYAQSGGEWVDEESPTAPSSFSGGRVLEGERLALAGPFPATVLRLGGIYGPGRERLIAAVRAGEPIARGPVPRYTNRIHRDDAARALVHVARLSDPETVYVGVDDEPADIEVVLEWIAAALGVAVPPVRPGGGSRAVGSKRCRNRRLRATGFELRYPTFREGYGALLSIGHDSGE